MIHLVVRGEQVVHDLNDWVVVPETLRIGVAAQLVRDVDLLALFELQYEHLLLQFDLAEDCFQVENIGETANSKHELDLGQLRGHLHSLELHLKLHSTRSLLVHLNVVDNDVVEDVTALGLVEEGTSRYSSLSSLVALALLLRGECSVSLDDLLGEHLLPLRGGRVLVQDLLQVLSLLRLQLVEAGSSKAFELLLDVQELFASSEYRVQVQRHQFCDCAAHDLTVEDVVELRKALLRVLCNWCDAAAASQRVVGLRNLFDDELVDGDAVLERLIGDLGADAHESVLENGLLVDLLAPPVLDLLLLFLRQLQVSALPSSLLPGYLSKLLLKTSYLEHRRTLYVVLGRVPPAVHCVEGIDEESH